MESCAFEGCLDCRTPSQFECFSQGCDEEALRYVDSVANVTSVVILVCTE